MKRNMNREIKFRGKRVDNGELVYGTYHYSFDQKYHYILAMEKFLDRAEEKCLHGIEVIEVIPETVGQYIGLSDKNGQEIYEFDIVAAKHRLKKSIYTGVIGMPKSCWVLSYEHTNGGEMRFKTSELIELEIIGNIFDNPELKQ